MSLRSRSGSIHAVAAAVAVAALVAPLVGPARAEQPAGQSAEQPAATYLVVLRAGSLWRMPLPDKAGKSARRGGKAEKLAGDPDPPVELVRVGAGEVTAVEVSRDRSAVVIDTADGARWAELPAGALEGAAAAVTPVDTRPLACTGRPHLSPDSRRVACVDRAGKVVVHQLSARPRTAVHAAATGENLGFVDAGRLAIGDAGAVWAVALGAPAQRTRVARVAPDRAMLVAPDGSRAVGVFAEGDGDSALYVFRLDGKGVKRRFLADAVPVVWSRDSRWVAAQQGKRACMIRARGGQYKCWRGFHAVAIAPDGSHLLMTRDGESGGDDKLDLYLGRREGVRSDPPKLVIRGVTGPATWLTGPP